MKNHWGLFLKLTVSTMLFGALLAGIGFSWGGLPAIGPNLNPFTGLWRHQAVNKNGRHNIKIAGLATTSYVAWDAMGIPHAYISQGNGRSFYFVQGYLAAAERLFQMDIQARAGSGRLAELLGPKALPVDEFFVRFGLRQASAKALEAHLSDPAAKEILEYYSLGVNAYIEGLDANQLPVEYRLLGVHPERWSPERSMNVLKMMSFRLAGRSYDLYVSELLRTLGPTAVDYLFAKQADEKGNSAEPSYPLPATERVPLNWRGNGSPFVSQIKSVPEFLKPFATNGSNAWAVHGKHTQSGAPLLANDTHLGFSLPVIWYELQMKLPKSKFAENLYGAMLPGTPTVLLGFTDYLAWGMTNGTSDAVDWSELEFQHRDSLFYYLDGNWEKAKLSLELVKVKGAADIQIPVIETQFGFVMHRHGTLALAAKWTGHLPGLETLGFVDLNSSPGMGGCRSAAEHLKTPGQNILCISLKDGSAAPAVKDGQIYMQHSGRYPIRSRYQGQFIQDGRRKDGIWTEYIPDEELPVLRLIEGGFARSANQNPIPLDYPFYLGWDYEEDYRAKRIRELLEQGSDWNPEKFFDMQNDTYNAQAAEFLPVLLKLIDRSTSDPNVVKELSSWDFYESKESIAASIYHDWYLAFEEQFWKPIIGERKGTIFPKRSRFAELLDDYLDQSDAWAKEWVERSEKGNGQSLQQMATGSLAKVISGMKELYGPISPKWARGQVRSINIPHIARFPGFGRDGISVSGSKFSINANQAKHGPSWKMVVELGEQGPRAWVNYPGGPSGDPFSRYYDVFLQDWADGKMRQVELWTDDQIQSAENLWVLEPENQ